MPGRRKKLFNDAETAPFELSRSKLQLFLECPRCFHLDRRLGFGRPPSFPFTLNNAVDTLLEKELGPQAPADQSGSCAYAAARKNASC